MPDNLQKPATAAAKHKLIDWFRQAMPYINRHRGKVFVMMLGGDAVADDNLDNLIHDIVLLNSLGIKIVIVHGVRKQLDEKLQQSAISSEFVHGLRVSTQTILEQAIQACSLVRSKLETKLSMGLPNSPMHGAKVRVASANVITAKPAGVIDGIDLQHTGFVRKIDTNAIEMLLDANNIVLLSPIGYSPAGEAFSLGHHHVATEIAVALGADKLLALIEADGVGDAHTTLFRELDTEQAKQLLDAAKDESRSASDASLQCLTAAVKALNAGVSRAHIMSFARDGALLQELFSVDGVGTLVQKEHFEEVRQAHAEDVPAIIELIAPLETQGVLVKRDREQLENEVDQFTVVEREGLIIALAALYPFTEDAIGEIACIVTHMDYRNGARGATLLQALEKSAQQQGLTKVFVLTTQTEHWFIERGFKPGDTGSLPAKKQSLYNYQRNSKVLVKAL